MANEDKVKLDTGVNFPGNSLGKGPKEVIPDKKELDPVVKSKVIRKKKPLGKQLAETFIEEDRNSVGHYILFEVLIPAARDTLASIIKGATDMFLYGTSQTPVNRQSSYGNPIISYNKSYASPKPQVRSMVGGRKYNLDQIIIPDKFEAELVISSLCDNLEQYGSASVADLLDLVGATGEFTDQDWGWDNLSTAGIRRVREGYLLILPPIKSLR